MIQTQLPTLYKKWFHPEILTASLQEALATCDQCAMSPACEKGAITYRPDLKCCTYEPFLPNFYVGEILNLNLPGAETLRRKIERRSYSLPIGMVAPVSFQVSFNQRRPNEFGNREDWLCPYYDRDKQNCGIWLYRGAVCTTFFCKSSYGEKGLQFWASFSDYLTYVEMALLEEALIQLDFSPRQIGDSLMYLNRFEAKKSEFKSSVLSERKARTLWNGYFDEQENFFKRTSQIIKNLDKFSFAEALGRQGEQLEENVLKSLHELQARTHL